MTRMTEGAGGAPRFTPQWARQILDAIASGEVTWDQVALTENAPADALRAVAHALAARMTVAQRSPRTSGRAQLEAADTDPRGSRGPADLGRGLEFWLAYESGLTLAQVGARHHLTRERVRQIIVETGLPTRSRSEAAQLRKERSRRKASANAAMVLTLWTRGDDPRTIARDLDLTVESVREVIGRHRDMRARNRVRAARHARSARTRFELEDAVEAVQIVADLLGRVPTSAEYQDLAASDETIPSAPTICQRWGWTNLLQAAGLAPQRAQRPRVDRTSEADCHAAVLEVAGIIGHAPTVCEYDRARALLPHLPCTAVVRRRLGGWAAAYEVVAGAPAA